jgi:hypothetical protein
MALSHCYLGHDARAKTERMLRWLSIGRRVLCCFKDLQQQHCVASGMLARQGNTPSQHVAAHATAAGPFQCLHETQLQGLTIENSFSKRSKRVSKTTIP